MKRFDMDKVKEASDFQRLQPGGYVCKITGVQDMPDREYLKLEYDIAEGEFKDHYMELYNAKGFWGGTFIKSYKESAKSFFKTFITAVKHSNKDYKWDFDERTLEGKLVGLVLGEEEYPSKDNTIKTRLYVDKIRNIEVIRSGNFEVPPLKKYINPKKDPEGFYPIEETEEDAELPF